MPGLSMLASMPSSNPSCQDAMNIAHYIHIFTARNLGTCGLKKREKHSRRFWSKTADKWQCATISHEITCLDRLWCRVCPISDVNLLHGSFMISCHPSSEGSQFAGAEWRAPNSKPSTSSLKTTYSRIFLLHTWLWFNFGPSNQVNVWQTDA